MMMDSPKPIGRLGGAYLSPKQSPVISKQQQQRTIVWTLDKTLRRSMGAFVEIMCKASDDDRTNTTTSTNQVRSRTKTKTHLTTAATTTAMRPGPARRYQRPTQLILTTITLQTILLSATIFLLLLSFGLMMMMIGAQAIDDDFFPVIPRSFRFSSDLLTAADSSPSGTGNGFTVSAPSLVNRTTTPGRGGSPFVWQPLPLRATFRPLNRQSQPPQPPREPRPPTPPEPPLALISERSISDPSATGDNLFGSTTANGNRFSSGGGGPSFGDDFFAPTTRANAATGSSESSGPASNFFQPQPPFATLPVTTSSPAPPITIGPTSGSFNSIVDSAPPQPTTTTPRPLIELDDELPTRQPSNRFRPTKAPSDDADTTQLPPQTPPPSPSLANFTDRFNHQANNNDNKRAIPSECFECICEASTNCNPNSRCQTSDVRHTRCGMFLISYDQWLTTGLSRELVTREALARDAAADERAFYDCVTTRSCSERLLAIFMAKNQKDCDRDGRVDCYDYAAIHHSGLEQCASESLLDSQYWNDFNACLGFGR